VSVAIGELADGLDIDLNAVPKKYDGLDGTELAISESQERMAVVVAPGDADRFREIAESENLEATIVAKASEEKRLVMVWNGKKIVDISREFLDSNGAEKHIDIKAQKIQPFENDVPSGFGEGMKKLAENLDVCSRRGLSERFDSTIGAGTVLMPFGGRYQRTPIQAMAHKISVEKGHTEDCSVMSWAYDPVIAEKSPYHSAYLAVAESIAKLIATGADRENVYLSFQEYFEKPMREPERWGKPLAALLGAFRAQLELGAAAIGGKDSMSGSFEKLDVPPTLVSFAVTTAKTGDVISPEFKKSGSRAAVFYPETGKDGLPVSSSLLSLFDKVSALNKAGKVLSAWTCARFGIAEGVMKMCFGNMLGFKFSDDFKAEDIFRPANCAFILELSPDCMEGETLGYTEDTGKITLGSYSVSLRELLGDYENVLENVYPCNIDQGEEQIPAYSFDVSNWPGSPEKFARPRALIPVFPGTNCEYDTAKVLYDAGIQPEIFVIRNLTQRDIQRSVEVFTEKLKNSQIVFIPGGFSGGDEPDGSGKFINAFFRCDAVKEQVRELLNTRQGLMCGICNGFQALIKLGLVPFGDIIKTDETCPTLTYNTIGRHQSKLVRTRIASNKSPWLKNAAVGDICTVPISHGEGRFICPPELLIKLAENGQIATQYVDLEGNPTMDVQFNPNGSVCAIEGITSPDGRVFGRMGHSERVGANLYKNVPGNFDIGMFRAAAEYYK
ncbi:MAG: phosphoribosylformylglycinamidine synthase subunit PurQ, partial [Oscillospiraceae bacterium]|nr:phosphoribosylformylglycinamidine synthase subunit PurQ [Oscillospiraceae bacterium]